MFEAMLMGLREHHTAVEKDLLGQPLAGRDPQDLFAKDGLLGFAKDGLLGSNAGGGRIVSQGCFAVALHDFKDCAFANAQIAGDPAV